MAQHVVAFNNIDRHFVVGLHIVARACFVYQQLAARVAILSRYFYTTEFV